MTTNKSKIVNENSNMSYQDMRKITDNYSEVYNILYPKLTKVIEILIESNSLPEQYIKQLKELLK